MELVDRVRSALAAEGGATTPARVAAAVRAVPGLRSDAEVLAVVAALTDEMRGAGPLQHLLADPAVTDVLVQAGGQVWVDRGAGARREPLHLGGESAVRALATRLVAAAGRRLDAAAPYADAMLPDGHRLHAVLPPVAVDGTCVSIRVLRPTGHDLTSLAAAGGLSGAGLQWVRALLAAGLSMVVTGATGAGKTTLLGALIAELDPGLRVLVVEDASELRPDHPQLVRLQARPPNVEGAGAVPLRDLVRQALRMRPDRLVLGEVRGAEVIDLLVAMNTGHDGGLCTLHANTPAEVPARFEALGLLGGLDRQAVHSLLGPALRVVLHLRRDGPVRRLERIGLLTTGPDGWVRCATALALHPGSTVSGAGSGAGPALPGLVALLRERGVLAPTATDPRSDGPAAAARADTAGVDE